MSISSIDPKKVIPTCIGGIARYGELRTALGDEVISEAFRVSYGADYSPYLPLPENEEAPVVVLTRVGSDLYASFWIPPAQIMMPGGEKPATLSRLRLRLAESGDPTAVFLRRVGESVKVCPKQVLLVNAKNGSLTVLNGLPASRYRSKGFIGLLRQHGIPCCVFLSHQFAQNVDGIPNIFPIQSRVKGAVKEREEFRPTGESAYFRVHATHAMNFGTTTVRSVAKLPAEMELVKTATIYWHGSEGNHVVSAVAVNPACLMAKSAKARAAKHDALYRWLAEQLEWLRPLDRRADRDSQFQTGADETDPAATGTSVAV